MSTIEPVKARKSIAVTLIGLLTILWGGIYAAFGGIMILGGDAAFNNLKPDDPVGGFAPILKIWAGLMIVIGVVCLFQGVPAILAGLGVLLRKQWGRIPTLIVSTLAILWGLLLLTDSDATIIAIGATQILYGILAFVILIARSMEFSRTQV